MRNRIIILFLFVGLSLPIAAQMHSAVEISVGGGWSTLGYKVQPKQEDVQAANKGSWGAQAHFGYAIFFTPKVGLGIGANFSHYGASADLSGIARWEGVTDTEGEPYNHLAIIHSLKDKQDIYLVEIPLTFYFVQPLSDKLFFNLEVGAKYGIPVMKSASFRADIEHQGDYGLWDLDLFGVHPQESLFLDAIKFRGQAEGLRDQLIGDPGLLRESFRRGSRVAADGHVFGVPENIA